MKTWPLVKTAVAYTGWRSIIKKTFEHPINGETTVDVLAANGDGDVGVIALTTDGLVLIAEQFRCGPEMVMQDIPGGAIDSGEATEHAAIRELREEVGYESGTIEYLGYIYREAWKEGKSHYFLAQNCTPHAGGQELDGFEVIEVQKVTIAELIDNAKKGRMTDPGGVLLAYDKLKELEKKYEKTN